jgi:choline dehydrogenase-like flavoprotein
MTTFDQSEPVVVVIGSGAGGGTVGHELAREGIDVVCLEAGQRLSMGDIRTNEGEMFGKLTWLDPRTASGGVLPEQFPAWICKTVGGTTMHWAACALRFQEHEWKPRTTYGAIDGASLIDWPVDAGTMAPWYARAEAMMGVTGQGGMPPLPASANQRVLAHGGRQIGYRDITTGRMAINSKPFDDRPGCQQLGFCTSGCAIGAKWSTMYTSIPKAEATGHFELRPESTAVRIEHDDSGRVDAVVYRDADGNLQRQAARAVCLAANAIETPRLLLLSASSQYPDGLANSAGHVGKHYMIHTTGAVFAVLPGDVNFHRGTQMAGVIGDEKVHDDARGFAGGYLLETLPSSLHGLASNLQPGAWGRDYANLIENFRRMAGVWICGEDLPVETNTISLNDEVRDAAGNPVAHVHFEFHDNDLAMQKHATAQATALYEAAGAERVVSRGAFSATHNMGTCRQSENPDDGVCNGYGQSHDIPNLFISDGSQFSSSAAENPTLTIVALAMRQAAYIREQLAQRAI